MLQIQLGSSWRYRHVTIRPYSIGCEPMKNVWKSPWKMDKQRCFHGLAHTFFTGSHQSKQKNKSAHLSRSTFSQHLPTQASPHWPRLDPIYYCTTTKENLMPWSSMWPITFVVGPKWFWLWPFHFGHNQIIMVKSKSIWSDQNHFGLTKTVLVT